MHAKITEPAPNGGSTLADRVGWVYRNLFGGDAKLMSDRVRCGKSWIERACRGKPDPEAVDYVAQRVAAHGPIRRDWVYTGRGRWRCLPGTLEDDAINGGEGEVRTAKGPAAGADPATMRALWTLADRVERLEEAATDPAAGPDLAALVAAQAERLAAMERAVEAIEGRQKELREAQARLADRVADLEARGVARPPATEADVAADAVMGVVDWFALPGPHGRLIAEAGERRVMSQRLGIAYRECGLAGGDDGGSPRGGNRYRVADMRFYAAWYLGAPPRATAEDFVAAFRAARPAAEPA